MADDTTTTDTTSTAAGNSLPAAPPATGSVEANAQAIADAKALFAENADPSSRDAMQKRIDELDADVEGLTTRNTELQQQLDAAIARADAAEKKAASTVTAGSKPAKPRKVGPMADGKALTDAGQTDKDGKAITPLSDAIAQADKDGKPVEIAFSDGTQEIADTTPVLVTGDVWKPAVGGGKMLRDPVTVTAPAGTSGFGIAGYGLLIGGKQVAWCPRFDTVRVAPGNSVQLADDIAF